MKKLSFLVFASLMLCLMGCDPVNPIGPNDPDNPGKDTTNVDPNQEDPENPNNPDQPTDTANIAAQYKVPNYLDINYQSKPIMDAEGLETVISRMAAGVYVYVITEETDYDPQYYMVAKAKDGSVLVGKDAIPGEMFRILEGGAYQSASLHAFDGDKSNYAFVTNPTQKHTHHYLYKDVYESRTAALADQLSAPGYIAEYTRLSVLAFCCEAYKLGDPNSYKWEMEETTLDGEQVKHFSIYSTYDDVEIVMGKPAKEHSSNPLVEYWVDNNWMTLQVNDTRQFSYISSFNLVKHEAAPQTLEDAYQNFATTYQLDGYVPMNNQVQSINEHLNRWNSSLYPTDFETKKFMIPYTGSGTITSFNVVRDGEWPGRSDYLYSFMMDGICRVEVVITGATYDDVLSYVNTVRANFPHNRTLTDAALPSDDMAMINLEMDNWDWEVPEGLDIDRWFCPEINIEYMNSPLINVNRLAITFNIGSVSFV